MPSSRAVSFVLIPAIAILAYFGYFYYPLCPSLCSQTCPSPDTSNLHSGYFGYECAGRPHHSSWTSWWHPHRSDGTAAEYKKGAGSITSDWNILYHLGGNGPWVEKVIDIVHGGIAVPEGCQVEQVHMVGHAHGMLNDQDMALM
jgi:acid phosphatase